MIGLMKLSPFRDSDHVSHCYEICPMPVLQHEKKHINFQKVNYRREIVYVQQWFILT